MRLGLVSKKKSQTLQLNSESCEFNYENVIRNWVLETENT